MNFELHSPTSVFLCQFCSSTLALPGDAICTSPSCAFFPTFDFSMEVIDIPTLHRHLCDLLLNSEALHSRERRNRTRRPQGFMAPVHVVRQCYFLFVPELVFSKRRIPQWIPFFVRGKEERRRHSKAAMSRARRETRLKRPKITIIGGRYFWKKNCTCLYGAWSSSWTLRCGEV